MFLNIRGIYNISRSRNMADYSHVIVCTNSSLTYSLTRQNPQYSTRLSYN